MANTLLKDVIKNKDYNELMKLVGTVICRKNPSKYFVRPKTPYESFKIEGFSKNIIYLGYHSYDCIDDEPFWGDGCSWCSHTEEVSFEEITDDYIVTEPATPKQKEWLDKYYYERYLDKYEYNLNKYTDDISKFEAWHIINQAVKDNEKRRKVRADRYFRLQIKEVIDQWYPDDDPPNM